MWQRKKKKRNVTQDGDVDWEVDHEEARNADGETEA